jgi:asparagine synthase (glutamine-hydrolysing)
VDKKVKMQGWERKSVLRKTIGKKLPKELLGASKKGFRVPVREWFKDPTLQTKLNNLGEGNGLFNKDVLRLIVKENATGKSDNGNLIWSLSVLDGVLKK